MAKAYDSLGVLRCGIIRTFGEHSERPYKKVAAQVEARLRAAGKDLGRADFPWIFHRCTFEKFFRNVPRYDYETVRFCFVEVCVTLNYSREYVNKLIDEWELGLKRRRRTKAISQNGKTADGTPVPPLDNLVPNYSLRLFRRPQIVILQTVWWEWYKNNRSKGVATNNGLVVAGSELSIAKACAATGEFSWSDPVLSLRSYYRQMRDWAKDYTSLRGHLVHIRPDLFSYEPGGDGEESNGMPNK